MGARILLLAPMFCGCTMRYRVRAEDLSRASTEESAAIPALDEEGRRRYVRIAAIEDVGEVDPDTLLVDVDVTDRSNLILTGWTTAAIAGTASLFGILAVVSASEGCADACDPPDAVFVAVIGGTPIFLFGLALAAAGYSAEEAEAQGPSPGMSESR